MKKKIFISLSIASIALGFTGCKEMADENPVYSGHEGVIQENFLNQPALKNQYINFTEEEKTGTLHLTCSQPNFGYNALATYKVQVSLDETFPETINGEEGYIELKQDFYDCANINPTNHAVAAALEKLSGVQDEADMYLVENYQTLFFRLRAYISQTPDNSQFISNAVQYDYMKASYYAVWKVGEPTGWYLRGDMNGWGSPSNYEFVSGEDEDTWILSPVPVPDGAEYAITAGQGFKVADSSWGAFNYGSSGNVSPGTNYKLEYNAGNCVMSSNFNGGIKISLINGNYYLYLDTEGVK